MSFSDLELNVVTVPPEDVKNLLASTIYGMKGKMQYRHKNSRERIRQLKGLRFITLRKSGKLLGTIGVLRREHHTAENISSCYFRYFSIPFTNRMRGRAPGAARQKIIRGNLKDKISHLIEHSLSEEGVNRKRVAYYAFIEEENDLSKNLAAAFGFEKIRKLKTFVFSRIFPSVASDVERLAEKDKEEITAQLDREYGNHSFYSREFLFESGEYFVFRDKGKITAGIKATVTEWEIVHVPGFSGFLIRTLLPRLPFLSRLFAPGEMRFAAFEAAWSEAGKEEHLAGLMESVCALLGVNMGIIWADAESPLAAALSRIPMGLLNRLKKDVPADIVAKLSQMPDEQREQYRRKAVCISALDMV